MKKKKKEKEKKNLLLFRFLSVLALILLSVSSLLAKEHGPRASPPLALLVIQSHKKKDPHRGLNNM
jgi:hypothetical protein